MPTLIAVTLLLLACQRTDPVAEQALRTIEESKISIEESRRLIESLPDSRKGKRELAELRSQSTRAIRDLAKEIDCLEECVEEGRCDTTNGNCYAKTDDQCAQSRKCTLGFCTARSGVCVRSE